MSLFPSYLCDCHSGKVTCWDCNGDGEVVVITPDDQEDLETCKICNGTAQVSCTKC